VREVWLVNLGKEMADRHSWKKIDTLTPKIIHGALEYWILQAEGLWEIMGSERTFWTPLEAGHKTLIWKVPSLWSRERSILIPEKEEHQEELNKQALLNSPNVAALSSDHFHLVLCAPDFPLFIKPTIGMFGKLLLGSYSPCKAPLPCKIYIK
jgi:hypothetical protein